MMFKFHVGEKVLHDDEGVSLVTHRFENTHRKIRYALNTLDSPYEYLSDENCISPIPSTPLDAEGNEIGLGDLVQPINGACVGRVAATDLGSGMIAVNPRLAAFSEDWQAKFIRILEKAPPKQITLGSRVRLSGDRAQVFTVVRGHIHDGRHFWASGDKSSEAWNETCLELIE